MTHDPFKLIETPPGTTLADCPVCATKAHLWRYIDAPDAPTETLVMCSNATAFGPQTGIQYEGCLLYMPPPEFYRDTIREAAKYWNEYAKALTELRERNSK